MTERVRSFPPRSLKIANKVIAAAHRMGLAMPGLALVRQFYVALKAQGHGRLGYHSLMLALEQLSAIKR